MDSAQSPKPDQATSYDALSMIKLSYTIQEAVRALGISRTTIYKLISCGKIKIVKIGARTLIPAGDLHALLSQNGQAMP